MLLAQHVASRILLEKSGSFNRVLGCINASFAHIIKDWERRGFADGPPRESLKAIPFTVGAWLHAFFLVNVVVYHNIINNLNTSFSTSIQDCNGHALTRSHGKRRSKDSISITALISC